MTRRWLTIAVALFAGDARADDAGARRFTLDVLPVLQAKCFACHGAEANKVKGGRDVRGRTALL